MITQIIVSIFVVFMLIKLLVDLRKNKISLGRFLFWVFIWIALVIIVFIPGVVLFLSNLIGIERAKDLPIYVSIIILFYLLFRIGIRVEEIEQEITKLVKNLALAKKK